MRTSALLTRLGSRLARAWRSVTTFTRALAPARRLGLSSRSRVINQAAAAQLHLMTESPAVYAALWYRCAGLQVYPLDVLQVTPGGASKKPIDPGREPWAAAFLLLLQRPDPADVDRVFPRTPGELLLAQVLADLLMTGTAYVRFQEGEGRRIVGLARLHPAVTALEVVKGQRRYRYRPSLGDEQLFRDEEVCVLQTLSWETDLRSEQGVGAAEPLENITRAEVAALKRTSTAILQGGVDLMIEATNEAGSALLMDPVQRKELVDGTVEALGKDGQRVLALGGPFKLNEIGLKPSDLRGAETQAAARSAQLMALGVAPVIVGSDPGGYATAAAQLRVQLMSDFQLATWMEVCLLRPLAQAFAAREGGARWAGQTSQITCAYNLRTHPGALAAETEAIARAKDLMIMGWSNVQAAQAQGLDLPPPEGEVLLSGAMALGGGAPPSQAAPAQNGGTPRAPIGAEAGRTLHQLLRGDMAPATPKDPDALAAAEAARAATQERAAAWRAIEDGRARSDQDLRGATRDVLDAERARYQAAVRALLEGAWDEASQSYGAVAWSSLQADPDAYLTGIGVPWVVTWEEASASALPDALEAPATPSSPATLDAFQPSATAMAATTRSQVIDDAMWAMSQSQAPDAVVAYVGDSWAFSRDRDLAIARTETVRAQSEGTNARYEAAVAAGIALQREWLSARDSHTREDHLAVDGQRVAIDEPWVFPNGVSTRGPGLSGTPAEDVNCRCAVRAVVL